MSRLPTVQVRTVRSLTPKSSIDSLKKEAKRWLKALRENDPDAHERWRRIYSLPEKEIGLRQVQHALALEFGALNWQALSERVADHQLAMRSDAERADDFLRFACERQSGAQALRILQRHPEAARYNLYTAVVSGDVEQVRAQLSQDANSAAARGGPQNWEPLQYLCYARLPSEHSVNNTLAIATALLDAGADPNATFMDAWNNPFTLITGLLAEGEQGNPPHPHAAALASLLIERGAKPYDTQSLYNTSLARDDIFWLDFLYSRSGQLNETAKWTEPNPAAWPSSGMLDYLLGNAVSRNHLHRARWLLAHGARATAEHFYSKRNLHTEALLQGFLDMAELLASNGAQPEALTDYDAFCSACMRLDRATAQASLLRHPEYLLAPAPMHTAANHDMHAVAALLLELGMSSNVGSESWSALHSAAWNESSRVAQLLIDHGALIDVRDAKHHATPLGHALYANKPRMIELLSRVSRDVFSLARSGNVDRLTQVLKDEPALACATHENQTLLFHLPDDDDRAIEIVKLLIANNVDVQAKNKDGLTPAGLADQQGRDEIAELLRAGAVQAQ